MLVSVYEAVVCEDMEGTLDLAILEKAGCQEEGVLGLLPSRGNERVSKPRGAGELALRARGCDEAPKVSLHVA